MEPEEKIYKNICYAHNGIFETTNRSDKYCTECKEKLNSVEDNIGFEIIKHKNGRTKKEATDRRLNHFKNEILPTIASKREKRYFKKKHGWK